MYGLTPTLIKAFLDSGAKAVICPSAEPPPESQLTTSLSVDFDYLENGKFEIGEEEVEEDEEEAEPTSSVSDWEDSDTGGSRDHHQTRKGFWDDDEAELSQFVCQLYDSMFREGASVEVALQHALASHRRLRYSCHLASAH